MAKTKELKLPYNGKEWIPNEIKSEIIFFLVHHYGGNTRSLHRHIKFINSLGFRVVSFELSGAHTQKLFIPPISRDYKWGVISIWADRLEDIISHYPEEEKIIFSLSNPSYASLECVYRIKGKNIKALIFDGGPFFNLVKCYWNLFTHVYKSNLFLRVFRVLPGAFYWNLFFYERRAHKYLNSFSDEIPILSFRAEKDILVPVESIDKVFKNYNPKNFNICLLKNESHLMGLKNQPLVYEKELLAFLDKYKIFKD